MIYDAIVIGTGPAGSTAAYELSRRGYTVLALEKKRHPRYKVCGGGLSVRLDRILGSDYHGVLEQRIDRLILSEGGGRTFEVAFDAPITYMMMRDRFDAYLLDRARKTGSEVREDEPAIHLVRHNGTTVVRTARGEYLGRTVIGADGVPSLVSKDLFPKTQSTYAVGLEAEIPPSKGRPFDSNGVLIDIGAVQFGYGWIFPKTDHLSLGVATFHRIGQDIRRLYSGFVDNHLKGPGDGNHRVIGHLIPYFPTHSRRLVYQQACLVGDAAGLVDPFLGEGIYYAIRSGQLAAEAIEGFFKDGRPLSNYQDRVRRELYPEFFAASRIAWAAYRFPRLFFSLAHRYREAVVECGKILQGRSSYQILWRKCTDLRRWFSRAFLS
jgi:geranylgeranyl reductase family protein